jgi:hypothetical protein
VFCMGRKQNHYAKEFKVVAVRLIVEEEGKAVPFPGRGRLSPENEAFCQLKRENERIRMGRDLFKKQWLSPRRNIN